LEGKQQESMHDMMPWMFITYVHKVRHTCSVHGQNVQVVEMAKKIVLSSSGPLPYTRGLPQNSL
jgi:hypothetical protein